MMMRKCVLVLSVSLFLTAGFIVYKASLEQDITALLFASAAPEATAAAPATPSAAAPNQAETTDEPPLDTDDVFRKVAALQMPAATKTPTLSDATSAQGSRLAGDSPLDELNRLAEKRSLYATQIAEISASLEAIQTEQAALKARAESLHSQRGQTAKLREQLDALEQERQTLEKALLTAEDEIIEQEHLVADSRKAMGSLQIVRERSAAVAKSIEKINAQQNLSKRRLVELDAALSAKDAEIAGLEDAIAALLRTEEESARVEASLAGMQSQALTPELEALRRNIAQTHKAAAAALVQKRAAREQAEKARDALRKDQAAINDALEAQRKELEPLRQEAESLQLASGGKQVTKEQLAAMEATLNQAKHQRQQLADKLAALAEIKRGMEDALHSAGNTQAEMDEIESALAESELQISRFLRDRDTYHSQLSAIDERLYSLQDDIRQALTTAESTLLGGPQPDAQGRVRSLVAALGDGAFAPGKAVLQDAVKPQVAKALAALLQSQGARVSVEGHTDDSPLSGPAKDQYGDNINLSYHRAKAVADALVEGGLPPAAVVVAAHGASRPSHPNDTLEGRSRNRRVEIWLVTQ